MISCDEAQEQEVLEKMIEGYKKLTPQYQKGYTGNGKYALEDAGV